MKINRKILIIIFIIIIVTSIFIIKSHLEYSLDEISALVDMSNNIPSNIYIKAEFFNEFWTPEESYTYEIYVKDDIIYTKYIRSNSPEETLISGEEIWNYKNNTITYINHEPKNIYISSIRGNGKVNPLTNILIGVSRTIKAAEAKYKYYGKTKIDGKEYIKISFTDEENYHQTFYYIDIEKNTLAKEEHYKKENNELHLQTATIFSYSYDTVTDEDILVFNRDNYSDYKYNEI